jgi:hypothetical protein
MERQPSHVRFSRMNSDRVIECAIRAAKNLLWQNLPPTHTLPDGATVARVRELVNSPSIQSALQCGSDTFLAFVLREVQFVIADRSLTDRQILARLWDVLDARHLNQALGITQRSRMILGPYPKRPFIAWWIDAALSGRTARIGAHRRNSSPAQLEHCRNPVRAGRRRDLQKAARQHRASSLVFVS